MNGQQWYVLTGGPCAGKTTLITKAKELGYEVVPEAARNVIDREIAKGRNRDELAKDSAFPSMIHAEDLALLYSATTKGKVFFDRSVIDSIAYCRHYGVPAPEKHLIEAKKMPFRKVFLLDLVAYVQDEGRNETEEEARTIHEIVGQTYKDLGFSVVTVPVLPVVDRMEFILSHLT